jgi:hypothetical protein
MNKKNFHTRHGGTFQLSSELIVGGGGGYAAQPGVGGVATEQSDQRFN